MNESMYDNVSTPFIGIMISASVIGMIVPYLYRIGTDIPFIVAVIWSFVTTVTSLFGHIFACSCFWSKGKWRYVTYPLGIIVCIIIATGFSPIFALIGIVLSLGCG